MKFFCLMIPATGVLLGALWGGVLAPLLTLWEASPPLRGVIMTMCTLALTGGLHMDGLMDTCDALFSRQDRETRLRILSDTHTGAFAVISCVLALLLQSAVFGELLTPPLSLRRALLLSSVPVWSRLGMGIMLNSMPFARQDGLARTVGGMREGRHTVYFIAGAALLATGNFFSGGVRGLWLFAVALSIYTVWRRTCLNTFGGLTGDLLGAFNVMTETALLLVLREVS